MRTEVFKTKFGSFNGAVWTIEITRKTDGTGSVVEAENFACDETPAEIEWKQTTRHESLCGSACTLHLESPGDGTFTPLYAAEYGEVILRLYRDDTLYWQGALDPEFYTEPFDTDRGYIVDLTFSDLGALKRLNYSGGRGNKSLLDLLDGAMADAGYAAEFLYIKNIYIGSTLLTLNDLSVSADNFFDEDGEPMTWYDVLEGVLTPLGLRLVQTPGGKFTVYNINGRFGAGVTLQQIEWAATGQTLCTDSVYKRIEVNYSPYDRGSVVADIDRDELTYKGAQVVTVTVYNNTRQGEHQPSFTMQYTNSAGWPQLTGCNNVEAIGASVRAMKLTRVYGGEDSAVFREYSRLGNEPLDLSTSYYYTWCMVADTTGAFWSNLHATNPNIIPLSLTPLSLTTRPDMLRVKLQTLLDVRYNPFESGDDVYNDKEAYKKMKKWKMWAIPILLTITSFDGSKTYYYRNTIGPASGWFECDGDASGYWGNGWLYYYGGDTLSKRTEGAAGGWQNNKHFSQNDTSEYVVKSREQGQYIPKPPITGTLSLKIGRGAWIPEADHHPSTGTIYKDVRWLLFKSVSIEPVDQYGRALEDSDIVYSADLDSRACNTLSVDTVCGSTHAKALTARGVYRFAGAPVDTMWVSQLGLGKPEALLIAQLASQYADVSLVLKGQISASSNFSMTTAYTDSYLGSDVRFLCTGAVYDLRRNTVEATLTEIKPINYNIGNVNG